MDLCAYISITSHPLRDVANASKNHITNAIPTDFLGFICYDAYMSSYVEVPVATCAIIIR